MRQRNQKWLTLKRKHQPKLFYSNAYWIYCHGVMGPLKIMVTMNQIIPIIPDRYTKETPAVLSSKSIELHITSIFVDHWIRPYGIPAFFLTENGPQFVRKFFKTLCTFLDIRHLRTTAYDFQIIGRAECNNNTISAKMHHYVVKHQRQWGVLY